jgi:hypothetical protein
MSTPSSACYLFSMGSKVHSLRSRLGAAVLSVAASGCIAQPEDTLRVHEELGRARAEAAWQQAHAAQLQAQAAALESRLSRLERTSDGDANRNNEASQLLSRLDRLLDMNERLLAERAVAPAPGDPAPAGVKAPLAPAVVATKTAALDDALTPSQEQRLRALVASVLAQSGNAHGGLTREQENALRLLMRAERKLDTQNPWPGALY